MWSVNEKLVVLLLLGFRFRVGVFAVFFRKLLEQSLVHSIGQAVHTRMVLLETLCTISLLVDFLLFALFVRS